MSTALNHLKGKKKKEKKTHSPLIPIKLFIVMPGILQIAPNVTLRLVPRSPDCSDCDTCQITDKYKSQPQDTSSLKIVLPPRLERLAKGRTYSSSSESSDSNSGLPPRLKRLAMRRKHSSSSERSTTEKSEAESDKPRLFIRIPPLKRPIAVAEDDKSDNSHAQDNEETRSLTEVSGTKSDASRLLIRLRPRQIVTATDDNSRDGNLQEKEDSSYSESSDDESDDEYFPPPKRQRRCLEAISNLPTSRARSRTSASASKRNKRVQPL